MIEWYKIIDWFKKETPIFQAGILTCNSAWYCLSWRAHSSSASVIVCKVLPADEEWQKPSSTERQISQVVWLRRGQKGDLLRWTCVVMEQCKYIAGIVAYQVYG